MIGRFDQLAIACRKDYSMDRLQQQQYEDALKGVTVTLHRDNRPAARQQRAAQKSARRSELRLIDKVLCPQAEQCMCHLAAAPPLTCHALAEVKEAEQENYNNSSCRGANQRAEVLQT
jgi:hypothetical protein